MRVLIIGCGYVGLRAADQWRKRGVQVAALTRSPDRADQWRRLGITPVVGDVLDPGRLPQLPGADLCLYAVGFDRSAPHDKRTVYVNGLRNVLSRIASTVPRLIYLSSTSVYGQSGGEWIDDESPCLPASPGGAICLDAEREIEECSRNGPAFNAAIVRLSGIYGPGRLIGRSDQLRRGEPLTGNPEAWLNLIHVDDVVQTLLKLGDMEFGPRTYLLSDARPVRRREFFEALAGRLGAPPPVFSFDGGSSLNKRCDSGRIRRELGLTLRYPTIEEGLRDAV